jgi:hypothetical protein
LCKGKVVKERLQNRYYRHRLFLWKRPFLYFKSQQGGNYACIQEKAYHSRECPCNVGANISADARAARIPSAFAYPGSKCRSDGVGTGDA